MPQRQEPAQHQAPVPVRAPAQEQVRGQRAPRWEAAEALRLACNT